eukprot:UN09511
MQNMQQTVQQNVQSNINTAVELDQDIDEESTSGSSSIRTGTETESDGTDIDDTEMQKMWEKMSGTNKRTESGMTDLTDVGLD